MAIVTKAEFVAGDKLRDGEVVTGSDYQAIVAAAIAGTIPDASSAAIFDELALDPYEVANAQ